MNVVGMKDFAPCSYPIGITKTPSYTMVEGARYHSCIASHLPECFLSELAPSRRFGGCREVTEPFSHSLWMSLFRLKFIDYRACYHNNAKLTMGYLSPYCLGHTVRLDIGGDGFSGEVLPGLVPVGIVCVVEHFLLCRRLVKSDL